MISHFRNILNLNDRYSYSVIGRLRRLFLPLFNSFLKLQENYVQKKVIGNNLRALKEQLAEIIPEVSHEDLTAILTVSEKEAIIKQADKTLAHEFSILSIPVKFKENIEWHSDFSSGFKWPKGKLYSKYVQENISNNADVKFPRELSRCHHLLQLGQAYLLTRDEKYTKEFIDEVSSWLTENPYKKSINWGCAMDVSIRSSNWIYSLRMFINSSLINKEFLQKIMTSLYLHGRFIFEHPEKNRINNHNHYLSDLAGLLLLSLLFAPLQIEETQLWLENGKFEFFKEIRSQILPTGFSYERTTNYHRLVTELIGYTIVVLYNNAIEIPQDILFRFKKMTEVVLYYLYPEGTAPAIGDQDNGRYLPFYPYDINYQRYLINVGAVLFNDAKFKAHSGKNNIEILFLFGIEGLKKYNNIEPLSGKITSRSFYDAGFYTMRSDNVYVFINNSGLSHNNEVRAGTHTHSDLLSFIYAYKNIPFLIDPGTYVYSSNPVERMKYRSTYMHNTITVDDYNQNDLKESELWFMKRDAIPRQIKWETNESTDIYEGTHTGFERLEEPVSHFRRFELNKSNDELVIIDRIKGIGTHLIKCHFHFDEKVEVQIKDTVVYCQKRSQRIKIRFENKDQLFLDLKEEYISKSYNQKNLAPYLVVSFNCENESELKTIIENY